MMSVLIDPVHFNKAVHEQCRAFPKGLAAPRLSERLHYVNSFYITALTDGAAARELPRI